MNRIKSVVVKSKDFVVRHKTAVAVVATGAVLVTANRLAIRDYKTYLDETDQQDAFIAFISRTEV